MFPLSIISERFIVQCYLICQSRCNHANRSNIASYGGGIVTGSSSGTVCCLTWGLYYSCIGTEKLDRTGLFCSILLMGSANPTYFITCWEKSVWTLPHKLLVSCSRSAMWTNHLTPPLSTASPSYMERLCSTLHVQSTHTSIKSY